MDLKQEQYSKSNTVKVSRKQVGMLLFPVAPQDWLQGVALEIVDHAETN
jgi:hypothetical protein